MGMLTAGIEDIPDAVMMVILNYDGDKPAWMAKYNPVINEIAPWIIANKNDPASGFTHMSKYSDQQVRSYVLRNINKFGRGKKIRHSIEHTPPLGHICRPKH